jgi:hypothetical protein
MCKQLVLLLAVLGFFIVSPVVQGATIIWVGENDDENGDGVADDVYWSIWLAEQGYTVDWQPNYWRTMDAAKVEELNQADLVIISRNTDSGDYANSGEAALWNSVTTPMILTTPYLSRNNRWAWVNHDGLNIVPGGPAWSVVDPAHAVFFGMDLHANEQVGALDAEPPSLGVAHLNGAIGNGRLIASAVSGEAAIVEWEPGIAFRDGGPVAGSRRLLFCAGTTEGTGNPQGQFNLTPVGQQMFLNAVKYMLGLDLYVASWPSPADGAEDVRRDTVLAWLPGPTIVSHDVYFGTDFDSVSAATRANPQGVLVSQAQVNDSYDPPGLLALDHVYYWRVDGIRAGGTVHQGPVWSFTVEPRSYPLTNVTVIASISSSDQGGDPNALVDGSGLDEDGRHSILTTDMWQCLVDGNEPVWITFAFDNVYKLDAMQVWNFNSEFESILDFGLKDVAVDYSTDGETWTTHGNFALEQGPGVATYAGQKLDLDGIVARYVRMTANSNYGSNTMYGLSEVGFHYLPVRAREAKPADGATDVDPDGVLSWRPGHEAVSHEVHLGTDPNALALIDRVAVSSYAPPLELSRTYYWRIDEVNAAETPAVWEGDVLSFSTADYLVVEDMESYTDEDGRYIYEAWVDGYDIATNGSQVGHDMPPYAEQRNVHSGAQSMPFHYGKDGATTSEATLTLATGQDWTRAGAQTLVLYFRGNLGNAAAQLYVKVNGTRVDYPGNGAGLAVPLWKPWNIDLATLGNTAKNVSSLIIGVAGSGTGLLYIDDIRLYREAPEMVQPVDPGVGNLVAHWTFEDSVSGSVGGHHGVASATVTYIASMPGHGRAAQFGGDGAFVDLPTLGNLVSTLNDCTFAFWVNWIEPSTWQRVFDIGTGTETNVYFNRSSGSQVRFGIRASGRGHEITTGNQAVQAGWGWHHWAMVMDADAGTHAIYLDGVLLAQTTGRTLYPRDLGNTTQNWLGRSQFAGDPSFNGAIDDFRIYRNVLSAGELRYLAGDR